MRMVSGEAITTSKFMLPALTLLSQVVHADDVGASGAWLLQPWRLGRTQPRAWSCRCRWAARQRHAPLGPTSWHRCQVARPRRWTHRTWPRPAYSLISVQGFDPGRVQLGGFNLASQMLFDVLVSLAMFRHPSTMNAHRTGGTGNRLHRGFQARQPSGLWCLVLAISSTWARVSLPTFCSVRTRRALVELDRLLDQHRGGRASSGRT